jgi:hypothetical protein
VRDTGVWLSFRQQQWVLQRIKGAPTSERVRACRIGETSSPREARDAPVIDTLLTGAARCAIQPGRVARERVIANRIGIVVI